MIPWPLPPRTLLALLDAPPKAPVDVLGHIGETDPAYAAHAREWAAQNEAQLRLWDVQDRAAHEAILDIATEQKAIHAARRAGRKPPMARIDIRSKIRAIQDTRMPPGEAPGVMGSHTGTWANPKTATRRVLSDEEKALRAMKEHAGEGAAKSLEPRRGEKQHKIKRIASVRLPLEIANATTLVQPISEGAPMGAFREDNVGQDEKGGVHLSSTRNTETWENAGVRELYVECKDEDGKGVECTQLEGAGEAKIEGNFEITALNDDSGKPGI